MFSEYESPKVNPELLWQRQALEEGRGRGYGASYEPFIRVQRGDLSSQGVSQTAPNPLLRRTHHLLSQIEYAIALLLMYLGAGELREQYRLSLYDDDDEFTAGSCFHEGTVSLAKKRGIRHPAISSTQPRILTTDFVVEDRDGFERAVFVRLRQDVPRRNGRQMQLLDLQNLYWQVRGIPFYVLTEDDLDPRLIDLLIWAYAGYLEIQGQASLEFLDFIGSRDGNAPLLRALDGWPAGAGDAVAQFKAAVFTGQIAVRLHTKKLPNLNEPWYFSTPVSTSVPRLRGFFAKKEARHVR